MEYQYIAKTFSIFNAVTLDNTASIASVIDISGAIGELFSIQYLTTAGEIDLSYELSLDKVVWQATVLETNLDGLTVGYDLLANTFSAIAKYIRWTATEKNSASTDFTAIMAIR